MLTPAQTRKFQDDPAGFIRKAIEDYTAHSINNRFAAWPDEQIWDKPLIGFADGDDPIFQEYKTIIGDYHVTPREVLDMYLETNGCGEITPLPHVSVISFIMPASRKTRETNRAESAICSVRWNHTRLQGQEFIARLSRYLVVLIESQGYLAVAPELAKWWQVVRNPEEGTWSSKWSQRHAAYAAGLGTFGLSDGFITPRGMAIRAGSVVCNLELPPNPRPYADHHANCLFYTQGGCMKCAARCPAGAISEKGHDKSRCARYLNEMRQAALKEGKGKGYIGNAYFGCGFCQTGVPCEERIPVTS
jgi:hypothetical protein